MARKPLPGIPNKHGPMQTTGAPQISSTFPSSSLLDDNALSSSSLPSSVSTLLSVSGGVSGSVTSETGALYSGRQPAKHLPSLPGHQAYDVRADSHHTTSSSHTYTQLRVPLAPGSRTSISASSASHKALSGTGSDRGDASVPILDMKRLLSKPAALPSASSSSISILSDAELSASASAHSSPSPSSRHSQISAQDAAASERRHPGFKKSREKMSVLKTGPEGTLASQLRSVLKESTHSQPYHRGSLPPSPRDSATLAQQHQLPTSKTRNVLRRKPSVRSSPSHSSPSTPTAATFNNKLDVSVHSPSAVSTASSSHVDQRTVRQAHGLMGRSTSEHTRPATSGASPRRVPSATARGAGAAMVAGIVGRPREAAKPEGLTPAGAVAHAYKQQEQRREQLAELSGANEHEQHQQHHQDRKLKGRSRSLSRSRSRDVEEAAEEEEEGTTGPYYTVFGSSSGRMVAAGGPQDATWNVDFDAYLGYKDRSARMGTGKGGAKVSPVSASGSSGVRSLSRKVSGRFKKVAGVGKRERDLSPGGGGGVVHGWTPFDGRPVPEKRSASEPKAGRGSGSGSVRMSTDEYVDVLQAQEVSSGRWIPSAQNGSPETRKVERELRGMRSFKGKDGEEKEKEKEKGKEEGGKLWKLMKRISTGTLRDKYVDASTPPPVPALPKDLQNVPKSRMTFEVKVPSASHPENVMGGESGILLTQFMQSRTSMSGVRPSTAPHRGTPRSEFPSRPSTAKSSASPSAPRQSTTTRSSSPGSSDIASSGFFHRTHSARSSSSSYGEEIPPMPEIGQFIMSPGEISRMNKDGGPEQQLLATPPTKRTRKVSRSRSVPVDERPERTRSSSSGSNQRPSLPCPPRRHGTAPARPTDSPPSPTIPSFVTSTAVNNFSPSLPTPMSLPLSEFGVITLDAAPPPLPKRSPRRQMSAIHSPGPFMPPIPASEVSSPRTPAGRPRFPSLPAITTDGRNSTNDSRSPTSPSREGDSILSSSSHARSPMKFRELESPRHAWSEKEKADMWDDLLERSARAGGTLHIGQAGLLSDNMRFSVVSDS